MPVTYQGTVRWDGHQTFFPFGDDDYTLNVSRDDDQALYEAHVKQVHIEFDSDETVDNWDDTHTWWDNFHHNAVDEDDAHARAMIDGRSVIVIGLLNLDKEHRGKPELHPVYALFVRVNGNTPSLRQSSWAFFVRNWGNQGYCGSDDQGLYTARQKISIKVPDVINITDNNIWEGAQNDDQLSPMQVSAQPAGDGIVLTFTLLTPDKQSWFVGDISFETREPVRTAGSNVSTGSGSPATESSPIRTEPEDKIEPSLADRFNKLPDNAKRELIAQLRGLNPKRKSFKVQPIVLGEQSNVNEEAHHKPSLKVAVNPGLVRPVRDPRVEQIREKRRELAEKFLSEHSVSQR